jgi:hypothetical protein
MLNAVLDRLVSVLWRPNTTGANRTVVPRLVALAVVAALAWGLLAAIVLGGVWFVRLLAGA